MAQEVETFPSRRTYSKVAAGQTTAQISVSGDRIVGRDYLDRVIITAASTAAPGAVTVLDGTTSLLVHTFAADEGMPGTVMSIDVGVFAQSTKGFNITTGTSVSVVAVGIFGPPW
jgi:hypothetical protein